MDGDTGVACAAYDKRCAKRVRKRFLHFPALEWVIAGVVDVSGQHHVQDSRWRNAMPTYQYRCEKCGEIFEHAEHLAEHETAQPACPKCGSEKVQHIPTPFVAKTSRKS